MEFSRAQRKPVTVPIVSLIDILTILLIFFIVTTTFKEPKPVIEVEIPVVSGDSQITSQVKDKRSTLTVSASGEIFLDEVQVLSGELPNYLESFLKIYPDRKLALRIDEGCPLGTMVSVWEALTAAGFDLKDTPMRVDLSDPAAAE